MLFPNKHLKVEDQFLQLPILADDWLKNLLNVDIVCAVLLQHNHVQYSLVDILTHLLRNLCLLLFESLVEGLREAVYWAGLTVGERSQLIILLLQWRHLESFRLG